MSPYGWSSSWGVRCVAGVARCSCHAAGVRCAASLSFARPGCRRLRGVGMSLPRPSSQRKGVRCAAGASPCGRLRSRGVRCVARASVAQCVARPGRRSAGLRCFGTPLPRSSSVARPGRCLRSHRTRRGVRCVAGASPCGRLPGRGVRLWACPVLCVKTEMVLGGNVACNGAVTDR